MKRCPSCKARYGDAFEFCKRDGARLVAEEASPVPRPAPDAAAIARRRKALLGSALGLAMCIAAVGAVVGVSSLQRRRMEQERAAPRDTLSRLKHVARALVMYAQENEGMFPPARGWPRALDRYLEDRDVLRNPAVPDRAIGFALNRALEKRTLESLSHPEETVLAFESAVGGAAPAGGPEALRGAPLVAVAFADGHVTGIAAEALGRSASAWEPPPAEPEDLEPQDALPVPSPPGAVSSALPGERFVATRTRSLTAAEIEAMNYARVRYAINEMFARYGFAFSQKTRAIRRHFETMSWYRPDERLTLETVEGRMSAIERENLRRLGFHRDALVRAGKAE